MSTKKELEELIDEITFMFDSDNANQFTTKFFSSSLNLSRTATSEYLNELFKDGKLIKVLSRPVYYYSKKTLESLYGIKFETNEFLSLEGLFNILDESTDDFHNVIGKNGSLKEALSRIKTALLYPGGLPMLLEGVAGSGKRFLVSSSFDFLKRRKLIGKDRDLIYFHPSYYDNENNMDTALFNPDFGFWNKAKGSMLYISHVEKLSASLQNKLADKIDYKNVNNSEEPFLIMSTTKDISVLNEKLQLVIPIDIKIPSIKERPFTERKNILLKFLLEEEKSLGKKIILSKVALDELLDAYMESGVTKLRVDLRKLLSEIIQDSDDETIIIQRYHIPKKGKRVSLETDDSKEFELMEISEHFSDERLEETENIEYYSELLKIFENYGKNKDFSRFIDNSRALTRKYYDNIAFSKKFNNFNESDNIEKNLVNILDEIVENARVTLPFNCVSLLSKEISQYLNERSYYEKWLFEKYFQIEDLLNFLKIQMETAYLISEHIASILQERFSIIIPSMSKVFLTLNIYFYNRELEDRLTSGIIICHGYSTATSMADTANTMLGHQVFRGIDMPLHANVKEIALEMDNFLLNHKYLKNVILLVDMGSLSEIEEHLTTYTNINLAVVTNASTAVALYIGEGLLEHKEFSKIVYDVELKIKTTSRIISLNKKKTAVLFISEMGLEVSKSVSELVQQSLPRAINIEWICIDIDKVDNFLNNPIFVDYDIKLIVGTEGLSKDIKTVSLEELVQPTDLCILDYILKQELNYNEIELFHKNLLKNLSLRSVMEHITILNVDRLMDLTVDAVSKLQKNLNREFLPKTLVGIYIHISNLIERLVTKNELQVQEKNTKLFEKNNQEFILAVRNSFSNLLEDYNVEIPISEIIYIYDYISNDKKVVEEEL